MKILMAYISATDQAISPRDKFLPLPLSSIIEYDLKEKEGGEEEDDPKLTSWTTMTKEIKTKATKNGTTTTSTTTYVIVRELTTCTGEEEEGKEEEKPSKEGEEKVDEEKKPDGDADGQGQPPGPGYVQALSSDMASRDGLYEKPSITGEDEDENPVFLGLKVYTKKEAVVTVSGRVRGEPESEDEDEWEDEEGGGGDGDEDEDEWTICPTSDMSFPIRDFPLKFLRLLKNDYM